MPSTSLAFSAAAFLKRLMPAHPIAPALASCPGRRRRATNRPSTASFFESLEPRVMLSTYTVTSLADAAASSSGYMGTLRWAIQQANSNPGNSSNPDAITFAPGLTGAITLTQGQLELTGGDTTIQGPGPTHLDVSGNSLNRIFQVDASATIALSGLAITNGQDASNTGGGGILNYGSLTLTNDSLSADAATNASEGPGGAISNFGSLSLANSTLSGNSATTGGGAIYNDATGALAIVNSTLSTNTVSNGSGAGIDNQFGPLTLTNSTLAGNSASADGGGILNAPGGTLTLTNSTLAGNSAAAGGGLFTSGAATLSNTLVATNTLLHSATPSDVGGTLVSSSSFNLIGDGSGGLANGQNGATGNLLGSSGSPLNPMLGPLANNGGPTQTLALLTGSPAINAGSNALALTFAGQPLATDQRGATRIVAGTVDIGAYEFGATLLIPMVTINQASGQSDPTAASPIDFTAVFNEPVIGFATGDVTLAGTAGATSAIVSATGNTGTTYNVAVTGMTANGTVIATIPAALVQDSFGNLNTASTSTDHTVTYTGIIPAVTINTTSGQATPASTAPIIFSVVFTEPVTGFATGSVTLSGTAGATTAIVSATGGSGATYNVAVTGMTGNGTVIATIPAGVAHDSAGNHNTASTSTNNLAIFDGSSLAPTASITGSGHAIASGDTAILAADGTSFGNLAVPTAGSPLAHTFTLANAGPGTLVVIGARVSVVGLDPADFIVTQPAPSVLAGSSTTFTVAFNPQHLGTRTATIQVTTNDPTHPTYSFNVSGTATTPLFDATYYLAANPAVAAAVSSGQFASAYQQYVQVGQFNGQQPDAFFNESFYLKHNADVAAAVKGGVFTSGFEHFVFFGQKEGRLFNPFYSESFYLSQNPDVAAAVAAGAFISGFEHFLLDGQHEGRAFSMFFDEQTYLALNPDVATAVAAGAFESGFEHFEMLGLNEHRPFTALYNEAFYLQQNPDVAAAVTAGEFATGYQQFIDDGVHEVRNYSPYFYPAYYLAANPDVAAAVTAGAFTSGLEHYALDGQYEGRKPVPASPGGAQPTIGALSINPSPVNPAAALTLTAGNLADAAPGVPGISQVQFWLAPAPASSLNTATDTLLGVGVEQTNGNWVLNLSNLTAFTPGFTPDSPGSYTLFARAQDTTGLFGPTISQSLTLT